MNISRLRQFAAAVAVALAAAAFAYGQKQAEVAVPSTWLRAAPDYNGEKLRSLQKGEVVVVLKRDDASGWTRVRTPDGAATGWVLTTTLTEARPAPKTPTTSDPPAKVPTNTPKPPAPGPTPAKQQKPTPSPATTPKNPPAKMPVAAPSPSPSPSPSPNPDEPVVDNETISVETEEVTLGVRVVGADGRPVRGLSDRDFKIFENGVEQPVTAVGATEVPIYTALVIDNSRSLRSQLQKVVDAGKQIAAANKPADETAVVRFVGADKIEVLQPFTNRAPLVGNALDNLFVEGGRTAVVDAIFKSAKMAEEYSASRSRDDVKIRALIVVTDGDDRGSSLNQDALFRMLRESNVQVYAVGFTAALPDTPEADGASRRAKAETFLRRLADETGGRAYFPDAPDKLASIAAEITGELRAQYVVSYAPTDTSRDGAFRPIKVEVNPTAAGERRAAQTRTGRTAGKQ